MFSQTHASGLGFTATTFEFGICFFKRFGLQTADVLDCISKTEDVTCKGLSVACNTGSTLVCLISCCTSAFVALEFTMYFYPLILTEDILVQAERKKERYKQVLICSEKLVSVGPFW